MYRKSVDYGQQSTVQISQFSVFKRKNGEQTPELLIDNEQQFQFRLRKSNNSIILATMMTDLLLQSSNKSKTKRGLKITSTSTDKIFKDFIIENVPKIHYNYQHENTLEQLVVSIYGKVKEQNIKQLHDIITNYTVTEFVLNCYARKLIKNYITINQSQFDLLGNQDQLLADYNAELRGQLLQALANSCHLLLCVCFKDVAGHLEDNYKQFYGQRNSAVKIEISDLGQYLKIIIKNEEEEVKLTSASSVQNILQNENKNRKQSESLNSTIEQSSRSANKDIRCSKCNGKLGCQCDKTPKRAMVTRQISANISSINGGPRSIFDSIGLGGPPKRQTSTHEINSAKR